MVGGDTSASMTQVVFVAAPRPPPHAGYSCVRNGTVFDHAIPVGAITDVIARGIGTG